MPDRLLVTGGAGFIGSSLAIGLKHRYPQYKIICFDNLRRRGSELNLPRLQAAGIQFVHGDIRLAADLDPTVLGADCILDCSADPSVLAGFSSPYTVLQTNLLGTANLLELARQTKAALLFLSTSRVYSIPALTAIAWVESSTRLNLADQQPIAGLSKAGISEVFPVQGHRSLYGATKLASELLIEEYQAAYGIPTLINRCGVITGPWQMGKVDQGVFALWMIAHYFQKPLKYIGYGGTGKQVRDLLHVEDLLELVDYQLQHIHELSGELFNVGGGLETSLSLLETTHLCEEITGHSIAIDAVPDHRPGDIPYYVTDHSKVTQRTGWSPQRSPRGILQDIYQWVREQEHQLGFLQP